MTTDLELFESTVELYKTAPSSFTCSNGTLSLVESKDLTLSERQADLLTLIFNHNAKFRNVDLQIDYDDANTGNIKKDAPCTKLKIEFNLYEGNEFCFYNDSNHLFSNLSSSLIQGEKLPKYFYLIKEDYKSNSQLALEQVTTFYNIMKWIDFLTQVSDIEKETSDGLLLYFFIKGEDDKFAKPLEIKINNLNELIKLKAISTSDDIAMLISKDDNGNLHHQDKQSFFKLALVDTLRKIMVKNSLSDLEPKLLFENLESIKSAYYEHYEVFIHNFAIGEFQQQVEEKGFEYAEKVSSVLNDIQVRLYAIPIVLVSLGALAKVDNIYSYIFVICGVVITGLFNSWMISDQVLRLKQIEKSGEFAFNRLKDQCEEKLQARPVLDNLKDIVDNIAERIAERNTKIKYYRILCWLPTAIAITALLVKERNNILDFFNLSSSISNLTQFDFICAVSTTLKLLYFIF